MAKRSLDLREQINENCKKCYRDDRDGYSEDGFCTKVNSVRDDLPVRCVGEWARDKISVLTKYFDMFSVGMKNKFSLNYIEICSGPGRCINRKNGEEFDGTALAITNHQSFKYVDNAVFIDNNASAVEALNARLREKANAQAYEGDYHCRGQISNILKSLNKGLNLVFIDPTKCDVPFSLLQEIKDVLGKFDLIYNIAMQTDVRRNIVNAVINQSFKKTKQRYSKCIDDESFFTRKDVVKAGTDALTKLFSDKFIEKLRRIGYNYCDEMPVPLTGKKKFYNLYYATANETGLKFWKNAKKFEPSGQKNFNFEGNL